MQGLINNFFTLIITLIAFMRGAFAKKASSRKLFLSDVKWSDLNVSPAELRPNLSLQMGQCFNWFRLKHPEIFNPTRSPGTNSQYEDLPW